jgi:hypothetical protein
LIVRIRIRNSEFTDQDPDPGDQLPNYGSSEFTTLVSSYFCGEEYSILQYVANFERGQNSTKKAAGRANNLSTHLIIFIFKLKRIFLANLIRMLLQVFDTGNEKFKICFKKFAFRNGNANFSHEGLPSYKEYCSLFCQNSPSSPFWIQIEIVHTA